MLIFENNENEFLEMTEFMEIKKKRYVFFPINDLQSMYGGGTHFALLVLDVINK